MILSIGEILFDIFPGYKRIGGAPFNFAFHLNAIGMPVRFISRIGKDTEGDEIVQALNHYGLAMEGLQIDAHHETGKVMVALDDDGKPDFNIIKNMAYDYLVFDDAIKALLNGPVDMIYYGTLIQRSDNGFKVLQQILDRKQPETRLLCDINLRPGCYNKTSVITSLKHADILKVSQEEVDILKQILKYDNQQTETVFAARLIKDFSIDMIAVTKGSKGSELVTRSETAIHHSKPLKNLVDTVGSGDGFTAILAIGYLKNWHPDKILSIATAFAEQICRIEGAIPKDPAFYDEIKTILSEKRHLNE